MFSQRENETVATIGMIDNFTFGEDFGPVLAEDFEELKCDLPMLCEVFGYEVG